VSDRDEIEFHIRVTGITEAEAETAETAETAAQATQSLQNAQQAATDSIRPVISSVRALNAARLAVQQTARAIEELDPTYVLYAFLNMVQVVYNLVNLMRILQKSTASAASTQAALAALTGRWYLIPLALAAAGLVYSQLRSYQQGGLIPETGIYLLHKGEYVVPANQITNQSFGPIFVSITQGGIQSLNMRELLDSIGPEIMRKVRRGG